ncbi:MAG: polysaccharide pyruvyl transferase family protein [Phyllobacteriaceae bacterium]|nr:polysaccharide pyruvyl transferase family protein [Phyllobacteriaceae bacterium]
MFWHVGIPNFGDDINPDFFERISGKRIRLTRRRDRLHFLGIGSILAKATGASTVLGSGFLVPSDSTPTMPRAVVALRGALSRAALSSADDTLLGDPLALADRLIARPARRRGIAYVPHCRNAERAKRLFADSIAVIDPRRPPLDVIADIAASEAVISQSLHGLIVADAFGVPNLWAAPHDGMKGRFKFDDYFSTLDRPKEAHAETAELMARPPMAAFSVGRFLHDKDRLAEALAQASVEGPRQ